MKRFVLILLMLISIKCYCQKNQYLTFDTGRTLSIGSNFLTSVEYTKEINDKTLWGVSYTRGWKDMFFSEDYLRSAGFRNSVIGNLYYKLGKRKKDKFYCLVGIGMGVADYMIEEYEGRNYVGDKSKIYPILEFSFILNIKLFKHVYLQTSPLLLLGPNRFYFTPEKDKLEDVGENLNILPIGVKVRF